MGEDNIVMAIIERRVVSRTINVVKVLVRLNVNRS